jgi:hypothetical protein
MPSFRSAYAPLTETRRPVKSENNEPSLTKASFAKDLNINNIIKKFQRTGILQKANDFEGTYGEFTSMDLREAIEKVDRAQSLFLEVPSQIRAQFNNDAGAFIDYATNPTNLSQLRDWGLANDQTPQEVNKPNQAITEPQQPDQPV